jgi:hypothetical protein
MSMSFKPNRKRIAELQATSSHAETGEDSLGNSTRNEEIRRRAYEIYLERGEQPGRELDDWLQAERELKRGILLGKLGWFRQSCGSRLRDRRYDDSPQLFESHLARILLSF